MLVDKNSYSSPGIRQQTVYKHKGFVENIGSYSCTVKVTENFKILVAVSCLVVVEYWRAKGHLSQNSNIPTYG